MWANVGELVFILESDGNVIPGQIVNIKDGNYIYSTLDGSKAEHNKCPIKKAGFNGGKIFKNYNNAKEYYNQIQFKGSFNMTHALMNNLRKGSTQSQYKDSTSRRLYEQISINDNYNYVQAVIISAMLLAVNKVKGIGPEAAHLILEEYSNILADNKYADLIKKVQYQYMIDLEIGEEDNERESTNNS